ncbi:unnamed protein product [Meloidogyne enterolobii]|uniref:Uncharacterized protein n=1 Tax=Meloidogyne enterolobii TaxID=390850 RepID=A0ACB1ANT6_MELEN
MGYPKPELLQNNSSIHTSHQPIFDSRHEYYYECLAESLPSLVFRFTVFPISSSFFKSVPAHSWYFIFNIAYNYFFN